MTYVIRFQRFLLSFSKQQHIILHYLEDWFQLHFKEVFLPLELDSRLLVTDLIDLTCEKKRENSKLLDKFTKWTESRCN